ncbi:flagellar biosynthetic protein FliR [Thalassococcus lentus]|uniref:Flagellar biosynthetic protein FliR n=1 Tax=Thalassococcus lentus TaxID=1210524 RepID=A0ABT4XN22_9RHOB|nr:flagellar biosynthetic protein FliR [Thalassococcus lentus]MDA7423334.1 flagellar biosynthetic protein FliR [Thalassococcus lentus]
MTGLPQLIAGVTDNAWVFLLVFIRVAAAMAVLPALGEQVLSVRIRLALALMLSLVVAPTQSAAFTATTANLPDLVWALFTETVSGLFIGLLLRLFIFALQTAGAIAAQSTSLSQLMGQTGADPLPAIGHILTVAALALLMATGFHVKAAAYIMLSYEFLPALSAPDPAAIAQMGRDRVAQSFALAFSLAAPFFILSVLYNLTLGVINKAMPQLMVAFVGAPVITFGSIFMLFLCAPVILSVWVSAVDVFLAAPVR